MVEMATIDELRQTLPSVDSLDDLDRDIEDRTRAVLQLLWQYPEPVVPTIPIDYRTCPNCDQLESSSRSPYCSDVCRERSAFVRQFRAGVEEKTIFDPLRQAALGQKLWFVLDGGYPRREPLVPARVVLKVIEREGGKCEQCGAKATTIDHSGSG